MLRSAGSSTHCRLLLGSGSPALSADELGRPDKARDLHERALRIFEREYGPDHVRFARTRTILGNAWSELRGPDKARALTNGRCGSRSASTAPITSRSPSP